ncbi:MAG: hypothetical protein B6245_14495 [Desulfobacteraceae bacterium 4572_88]|nr:MAG: hypothetical protein B6245_14495 [Desulfobacteraceae bacterium 4572_88]
MICAFHLSVTFLSFPPGNLRCDNRGGHGEGAEITEDYCGSALSVPSSRPLRLKKLKKVTLISLLHHLGDYYHI